MRKEGGQHGHRCNQEKCYKPWVSGTPIPPLGSATWIVRTPAVVESKEAAGAERNHRDDKDQTGHQTNSVNLDWSQRIEHDCQKPRYTHKERWIAYIRAGPVVQQGHNRKKKQDQN